MATTTGPHWSGDTGVCVAFDMLWLLVGKITRSRDEQSEISALPALLKVTRDGSCAWY